MRQFRICHCSPPQPGSEYTSGRSGSWSRTDSPIGGELLLSDGVVSDADGEYAVVAAFVLRVRAGGARLLAAKRCLC
jgi:hypothetical protein